MPNAKHGLAPDTVNNRLLRLLPPEQLERILPRLEFHEFATNAEKHGALSMPGGSVHVSWHIKPTGKAGRQVEILWREAGGPLVSRPERQGFGSHLLGRGLGQFGSALRQDFQPSGLQCHICFPLGVSA